LNGDQWLTAIPVAASVIVVDEVIRFFGAPKRK